MIEITAITNAITLVMRLRTISDNIRNAEIKNLLADLRPELAEVKMKMAGLMNENLELQTKIKELESVEREPCPKCRKRGWQIEKSQKQPQFGGVGICYEPTSALFVVSPKRK